MGKFRPGIPDGFALDVEPIRDLGDYLDEPVAPHRPPPRPAPATRQHARPITTNARAGDRVAEVAVRPRPSERKPERAKPKGPRREVSMTPEAMTMTDALLARLRSGSGQRDTKASELFHALVLLASEAVDRLDVHALPKRGRWGTPTAHAYPRELKDAIRAAVCRNHSTVSSGGD